MRLTKFNEETGQYESIKKPKNYEELTEHRNAMLQRLGELEDKDSDVAEEIFAEIEHTARAAIILLKFEKDEKIRNIKTECYIDLIGYIAELKKKSTEEGK